MSSRGGATMGCAKPGGATTPAVESLGPTVPAGTSPEERALLEAEFERRHPTDLNVPTPAQLAAAEQQVRAAQSARDRARAAGADAPTVARLTDRLAKLRETTRVMTAKVRAVDAELAAAERGRAGRSALQPVPAHSEAVAEMRALLRQATLAMFPELPPEEAAQVGARRTADAWIAVKTGFHQPKGKPQAEGFSPESADGLPTADVFTLLNHDGSLRFEEGTTHFREVGEDGRPPETALHSHYRVTAERQYQLVERPGPDGPRAELVIGVQLVFHKDPFEREQQVGWAGRAEGERLRHEPGGIAGSTD